MCRPDGICTNCLLEFTVHQREVFCVFSGEGVSELREHLNHQPGYAAFRDRPPVLAAIPTHHRTTVEFQGPGLHAANGQMLNFDEAEVDAPTDDDGLDEGSEMIIDVQPPPGGIGPAHTIGENSADIAPIPPPTDVPHIMTTMTPLPHMPGGYVQLVRFPEDPHTVLQHIQQADVQLPGPGHPAGPMLTSYTTEFVPGSGPIERHMPFPTSTASMASVRAPLFQGSTVAGPSTTAGNSLMHTSQIPAATTSDTIAAATGESTASLARPSSSHRDGPELPTVGNNGNGV
jgi:hypothetical protein